MVDDFLSDIFDVLVSAAMPFFALLAVPLVGGRLIEVFGHYGKGRGQRLRRSDHRVQGSASSESYLTSWGVGEFEGSRTR